MFKRETDVTLSGWSSTYFCNAVLQRNVNPLAQSRRQDMPYATTCKPGRELKGVMLKSPLVLVCICCMAQ